MEKRPGGRWLYPLLFSAQTLGAAILFLNTLPLYRRLVSDPGSWEVDPWDRAKWSIPAMILIHIAYWTRYRLRPSLPNLENALVGHLVLFASRLGFVLPTGLFSFLFIARRPEALGIPASGIALLLLGLFSMFCTAQEMDRWGKALLGRE